MPDLIEAACLLGRPAPQFGGWVLVPRTMAERISMWWHARCGRARFLRRNARGLPEYVVTLDTIRAAQRR